MIQGINNATYSLTDLQMLNSSPSTPNTQQPGCMGQLNQDTVSISKNPAMMTDTEAEQTMQDVLNGFSASPAEALSAHGGLDLERVMALLGDL